MQYNNKLIITKKHNSKSVSVSQEVDHKHPEKIWNRDKTHEHIIQISN